MEAALIRSGAWLTCCGSSNSFACWSHSAAARKSASRMHPRLLAYANTAHWRGWNSAHVMT
jgi:hypothetical protein